MSKNIRRGSNGREKRTEERGEGEGRGRYKITSCTNLTVGPVSADSANSVQGSFSRVHMKKGIATEIKLIIKH